MTQMPSLFSASAPSAPSSASTEGGFQARSLRDLLYDGCFMLFLLKEGREPDGASEFVARVQAFLADFERGAKKLNVPADDVYASKFAFCAAIDEAVLASSFKIRAEWERRFTLDRYQQDIVGLMTMAGAENQVGER